MVDRRDRDLAFALALGCAVLAFGLAGWSLLLDGQRAGLRERNELLEAELADLRAITGGVSPQDLVPALEQRIAAIQALAADRGRAASFVGAVAQSVPKGAWLTDLRWSDAGLALAGRSDDPAGAAEVMDGLRRTGCFDDVTLASVSGAAGARTFSITATTGETCDAPGPGASDPFRPPIDPLARPDLVLPPLYRWAVESYDVIAIVPGKTATLRDPDGGTHALQIGSAMGHPAATVSFITEDQVLLTQDRVVDQETGEINSSIIELPLE
jgi:Tfp pilus assembly protein PilN